MASTDISSRLAELASQSNQQPNLLAYQQVLAQILSPQDTSLSAHLIAFVDAILSESLGILAAKALLGDVVKALREIPDVGTRIDIGRHALHALDSRVVSFEEQDALIREILADAYQAQEDYVEAAKMLQGIQLDSAQRRFSDDAKVKTWIRICRLYLEEDDTTSAESYLNRAKILVHTVTDKELRLTFQLCQARILDARRKFLEASQAYHSFSMSLALAEEERTFALSKATICAVLAPAGPHRSRVLGKLFKDDRTPQLEEFSMLEKMYLDRLISPEDMASFAGKLSSHQLAQTADGSTVLAKAVVEHNLLAASRLYSNIGFGELGLLLGLSADKAEEHAARMLEQERLVGRIDQIDGVVFFSQPDVKGNASGVQATSGGSLELRRWADNVQNLTEEVERVSSLLQSVLQKA